MLRFSLLLENYITEFAENNKIEISMESYLRSYIILLDTDKSSKFVLECLSRLLFISCAEPMPNKFLATMKRIPRVIKEFEISLVIFENFFAYRLEIDYELLIKEVERLIKEFKIAIVISRPKQVQMYES